MAHTSEFRQVQLVGRKIRQLRKERHQTQTELAMRLGIQQSDLSRMEKGEYRVSLDTLFKVLAEFRIGVGEFFEEVARESLTPRDLRLVSDFHDLDAHTQREVESYIHDHKPARRMSAREPAAGGWNRTTNS
jgi:transcriptional regulator with XRE-family HTH domain